jgi:signal transduction histidine kinase/DNA-binding response OmpR family regulator
MSAPRPRILVLEDRAPDRLYLTSLLNYYGYAVTAAADGVEGLAAAVHARFDLIISDVLMPRMDGYEFVRRLRKTPAGADVPVLFYTATYHEAEARALAAECGVVEVLLKPSEPQAMLDKVAEVLARGRVAAVGIADEPFERRHAQVTSDKLIEKIRDLEASERRLGGLVHIGHQLIAERDPVALLNRVCATVRETTVATYAMVGLASGDGQGFSLVMTSGHDEPVMERLRALTELPPPLRQVIATNRAIRGRTADGRPEHLTWHPPVSSYLLAPLASRERVLGVIAVTRKAGDADFSDADEQLAVTLGVQAGIAYENARLINDLEANAAALREREATTEFALSAAGVGVYERNLVTNRIRQSAGLAQLFRVPAGATLDDLYSVFDPDERARLQEVIERAIRDGSDFSLDFRITQGPSPKYFHARGRVETIAHGQPSRLVSVVIDMTERRQLESHLRQAQKMEAIGQLASGVAHDFNNLLTVILGYSRFLLDSTHDEEQRKDVTAIAQAGERAAGLTRQLLAFSRRQAREIAVFDVNSLIEDLAGMLRRMTGDHVRLATDLGAGAGTLNDDRGQVEQVIINLVVNARDAMPGGGEVRIETGAATADGREWVRIAVGDNGSGMTDEVKARIFEPFFTTKEAGKGTGLGLATVASIVAQSGGRIDVDSAVGRGTTFTILLPRADGAITPVAPADPRRLIGHERILLVEDDQPVRELAMTILSRSGYRVSTAGTIAAATATATEPPFDLLISDVLLTDGVGPDLYRRLAARQPNLRVLYASGYAPEETLDVRRLGAEADFLAKPFTAETLTRKVRELLDR